MENSNEQQNVEDLEDRPIIGNSTRSSDLKAEPENLERAWKRSPEKKEKEPQKTAEVLQAQAQAEDFWRKIYNTMKNVESKEQAETLFKGLSSSKRIDGPAKIEAQGEWQQSSHEGSRRASELRAREKSNVADVPLEIKVDASTQEIFPYNAKKLEESYASDVKLLKMKRRKKCLCCTTERLWCTLLLLIPILAVLLVLYFIVLTPKDPTASMGDVSIRGFTFINSSSPRIETAMNFTVRLKNPNRFADIVYEQLDVLLSYRSTSIGSVTVGVAGYKQQEKNVTLIHAQLPKTLRPIADAADAEALKSDVAKANVRLELKGIAEGHFKIGTIKMGGFEIPVDCLLNVRPETSTVPAALLSASCYN